MTITAAVASDSNSGSRRTAAPARCTRRGRNGHSLAPRSDASAAAGSTHAPPGQPQIMQQAGSAELQAARYGHEAPRHERTPLLERADPSNPALTMVKIIYSV